MVWRGFFALTLVCSVVGQAAVKTSLSEAFQSARTKNELLPKVDAQLDQTDAQMSRVKGGILPTIGLSFDYKIQDELSDPALTQFSPRTQTNASVFVNQALFRGLREWNGLSQLEHQRAAQEANKKQETYRLYQDTAAAYLQVLSLEEDLKNLGEQATLYAERVKELTARVKRGESNQTDSVNAEATEAALAAEIQLVQGQLEVARENLVFTTGLSGDTILADPKLTEGYQLQPLEKYLERVEQRPDVIAAKERVEAADKGVTVAWGAHFPTADIRGNYYLTRPGFLSDIKWDVGVFVTVPLFEGGSTQAGVREAVSRRKEAEIDLERARRKAKQEIRSNYRQLKARLDQAKNLKAAAELSKKNITLLQRDYRRGLARNIDVQLALTEYRVSQRTLDQAHFASQLDLIQLQCAVGQDDPL